MVIGTRKAFGTFRPAAAGLLLLLLLLLSAASGAGAQSYQITGIAPLAGDAASTATGVNSAGDVVGYSVDENGTRATGFVYRASTGTTTALPGLGGVYTLAYAINDSGTVVGSSENASSAQRAVAWDQNGQISQLIVSNRSDARAINNAGVIAGQIFSGGAKPYFRNPSNGAVNILTPPASNGLATTGFATGINAGGVMTGQVGTSGSSNAFRFNTADPQAAFTLLPNIDYPNDIRFGFGIGNAINASGVIVGRSTSFSRAANGAALDRAALWTASNAVQELGTLAGYGVSEARAINTAGAVVGYARTEDFEQWRAFLYRDGAMTDLNSLVPANSGWTLYDAYGINDDGTIVGNGLFNGVEQTFVLTSFQPVPAPPAAVSLGIGSVVGLLGAGVNRSRRRKAKQPPTGAK